MFFLKGMWSLYRISFTLILPDRWKLSWHISLVLVLFACKGFAYTSPDISENAGIIAIDDVQQVMDQPHVSIPVHELEGLMETDLSVDNDNDEEESVRDKKGI